MRSKTLLTFRSESRPKSVSTNGAEGGVSGRKPNVNISSQSAASRVEAAFRFRDDPVGGSGEEQRMVGGGAKVM